MSDPTRVFDDLREEGEELDRLVAELGPEGWALETPAARWTVAHQIAHLAWTDHSALLAVTDQEAFRGLVEKALAAPSTFVDDGAAEGAAKPPGRLLDDWRAGRAALLDALYAAPRGSIPVVRTAHVRCVHGNRAPYGDLGPRAGCRRCGGRGAAPYGSASACGAYRGAGPGLRIRCARASRAGRGVPGRTPRPVGDLWSYGPEDAPQRVTGPALDFCLLVTQRAHRADLAVEAVGPDADRWLDIAQAFAGPTGTGRPPKGRGP